MICVIWRPEGRIEAIYIYITTSESLIVVEWSIAIAIAGAHNEKERGIKGKKRDAPTQYINFFPR